MQPDEIEQMATLRRILFDGGTFTLRSIEVR